SDSARPNRSALRIARTCPLFHERNADVLEVGVKPLPQAHVYGLRVAKEPHATALPFRSQAREDDPSERHCDASTSDRHLQHRPRTYRLCSSLMTSLLPPWTSSRAAPSG